MSPLLAAVSIVMHRRATILLSVCAILLSAGLISTPAQAQSVQGGSLNLEAGLRLGLGDWADISGPGLGLTIGGHLNVLDRLTLTLRAGFFYGFRREETVNVIITSFTNQIKTNEIPILAGGRFFLLGDTKQGGLWLGPELGVTHVDLQARSLDRNDEVISESSDAEVYFSMMFGGGYDLGQLDIHAGLLWIPRSDNDDDLLAAMITLGVDLVEF